MHLLTLRIKMKFKTARVELWGVSNGVRPVGMGVTGGNWGDRSGRVGREALTRERSEHGVFGKTLSEVSGANVVGESMTEMVGGDHISPDRSGKDKLLDWVSNARPLVIIHNLVTYLAASKHTAILLVRLTGTYQLHIHSQR